MDAVSALSNDKPPVGLWPAAGLIAGVVLAFSPVFVVLPRFDDPDMTVTLLSVCVAYTMVR